MNGSNPVRRDQLVAMFASMRANAPWYVDGPLLWGYFFFSERRATLESLSAVLVAKGYRQVALRPAEKQGRPTGGYLLHLEQIEQHSVDSLHQRNKELAYLAVKHHAGYDGMDVGPAV